MRRRFSGVGTWRKRAHIVQPVGELNQQHAHVARHGQDKFLQVLRLLVLLRRHFELGELGDALDQIGDLAPNLASISSRVASVSSMRIVQQPGDDGGGVELVFGEDAGDLDRVGEIGIAGMARLGAVLGGCDRRRRG